MIFEYLIKFKQLVSKAKKRPLKKWSLYFKIKIKFFQYPLRLLSVFRRYFHNLCRSVRYCG